MNTERTAALGLEPLLTTRELANYYGVNVQAIYDLRCDRRGPAGIYVGRELRYRVADTRVMLPRVRATSERFVFLGASARKWIHERNSENRVQH